jgi:hypothetical protein
MAGLRITLKNAQIGSKIKRSITRNGPRVRAAMRATAEEAADMIMEQCRNNIHSAGNFGSRWIDGFQAVVGEGGGHIRIRVTMAVPYWTVFQTGKIIYGKPLLWIPLDFATDAKGVRARDYPGQLFRVNRKVGAPLLMAPGSPAQPKYFGKEQVTIPKKFRVLEIIERIARNLQPLYRRNFKRTS